MPQAIVEKCPHIQWRLRWADEDFGCNVGDVTSQYLDGQVQVVAGDRLENNSQAALELAAELIGLPEYYKRDEDGRIVRIEEVGA